MATTRLFHSDVRGCDRRRNEAAVDDVAESPLKVSFQGGAAQGGIPYFTINNLDFDDGSTAYNALIYLD